MEEEQGIEQNPGTGYGRIITTPGTKGTDDL